MAKFDRLRYVEIKHGRIALHSFEKKIKKTSLGKHLSDKSVKKFVAEIFAKKPNTTDQYF